MNENTQITFFVLVFTNGNVEDSQFQDFWDIGYNQVIKLWLNALKNQE